MMLISVEITNSSTVLESWAMNIVCINDLIEASEGIKITIYGASQWRRQRALQSRNTKVGRINGRPLS